VGGALSVGMQGGAPVFITRKIPEAGLEVLRRAGVGFAICQTREDDGVSNAQLLEGVYGCQVLLSLLTEPIDREVLQINPNLLGIAQMAVGFNNIDVEAATELGIPVAHTPDVLTETTADLTWALLMAGARHVPQAHNYMVSGKYRIWGPNLFLGTDVGTGADGRRKVLGIVGYGRIGSAVAKRATGFDMRVLASDPYAREAIEASDIVEYCSLDEMLPQVDFLTLHPLLTEETHHLINEERLRKMKPTALLVNASRGPVVDEKALVNALSHGWIGGAALDVYEHEPRMAAGLAELDNVVLLPHIASATADTRGRMATMAAENALAFLDRRQALNPVNLAVYDTEAYRRRIGAAE
jgi:glyoxylate reductase